MILLVFCLKKCLRMNVVLYNFKKEKTILVGVVFMRRKFIVNDVEKFPRLCGENQRGLFGPNGRFQRHLFCLCFALISLTSEPSSIYILIYPWTNGMKQHKITLLLDQNKSACYIEEKLRNSNILYHW